VALIRVSLLVSCNYTRQLHTIVNMELDVDQHSPMDFGLHLAGLVLDLP
jgi:hypothetical protein